MFKSLLAIGVLLASGLIHAAEIDDAVYTVNFTDKHNKIIGFEELEVGNMSYGGIGSMKDKNKISNCVIDVDDPLAPPIPIEIYSATDSDTFVSVFTISKIRDTFHMIISLKYEEDFSTENAIKINDKCTIANNVATLIDVNWAGDINVGEKKTIKLPNNNELYMEVIEGYPEP
jgi:hypothetical protein